MKDFTGLLKIAGIEKSGSPFGRRLLSRFPDMKVGKRLLDALLSHGKTAERGLRKSIARKTPVIQNPLTRRATLLEAYREGGADAARRAMRSNLMFNGSTRDLAARDLSKLTVKDLANKQVLPPYDWKNVRRALEDSRYYRFAAANAARKVSDLAPDMAKNLDAPISARQFMQMYPTGRYAYKGGVFDPGSLKKGSPIWVSGRLPVAVAYAHTPTAWQYNGNLSRSPELVTTFDLSRSKAYRTGKTFFTPHVADANRRTRINRTNANDFFHKKLKASDAFPDYEMVLPWHEARSIPTSSWVPIPSSTGSYDGILDTTQFHNMPFSFARVKDPNAVGRYLNAVEKKRRADANLLHFVTNPMRKASRGITDESISQAIFKPVLEETVLL